MVVLGVMNFLHGHLKLQDVSLYIHTADHLCPLYRGGGTYSELVCMGINILLYIFILIYVYKHVCMCVCMCVFIYKNMAGYYNKVFFFPLKNSPLKENSKVCFCRTETNLHRVD
jgi:hypothetical protein